MSLEEEKQAQGILNEMNIALELAGVVLAEQPHAIETKTIIRQL